MKFMGKVAAAEYLEISEATLMAYVRSGKIKKDCYTYLGSKIKFIGEKLDEWLLGGGTGKPKVRGGGFKKKTAPEAPAVKKSAVTVK